MYKLDFEPNDTGRQRYEICFQAVMLCQQQIAVSEWDDVIDLLRKIKSVGEPAKEKLGNTPLYDMRDSGGVIFLEKGEYKKLIDFVKQPIWRPHVLEDVREVKTWLEGLKHESGSTAPDARPEEKRRAEVQVAGEIKPKPEPIRAE